MNVSREYTRGQMQSMDSMEASTSTGSGKLHILAWKLRPTSMEVSMEAMFSQQLPWKLSWKFR